ncbi:hypothetical protein C8J56DRAFT_1119112 [Mycena floridula]|nr:hypothetical protein C8J56DRAFT_1119112 [Mycena floridula]
MPDILSAGCQCPINPVRPDKVSWIYTSTADFERHDISPGTDVVTVTSSPVAASHTVNPGGPGHKTPVTVTVTQPQVSGSAQAADATNSPAPSGASSKSKAPIILGAVIGSIIGLALIFFLCMTGLRRYSRYKRDRSESFRQSMFVPTEDHHEVIVDDHHDDVVSTAMEKRTATLPNFGYSNTADIEKEAYGGYETTPVGSSYQTPMASYQSPMGSGTLAGPMGVGAFPNAHYRPHQGFDSRYPQPNFTYQPDSQIPHTY